MTAVVDAEETLTGSGPLIVEVLGTPGSGKTSATPGIEAGLARAGWNPLTPRVAARRVAARTRVGGLVGRLPSERAREILLWRVFAVHRLAGVAQIAVRDPGHVVDLIRRQRRRPPGALARRRRALSGYLKTAGAQEFFRRHAADTDAVVYDEGHVHRVVQLFSSPVDRSSKEVVESFVDRVPIPDLLVIVRASSETCLERVRRRGVWDRLGHLDDDELAAFVGNAADVVSFAARRARAAGWPVVEVDNASGDPDGLVVEVVDAVAAAVSRHRPGGVLVPGRPLYRVPLPRPGRLAVTARAKVARSAIVASDLDDLFAHYGIERTGRPVNLALGRRSASVAVPTGAGRLVVRAYPDHWLDETIRYEHSVLTHLERRAFPATRLVAAADGTTVRVVGGQRMTVFGFVDGATLSGSYISVRTGLSAVERAGGLLARLHAVTADVRPEGAHHLGMDGTDGGSRLAAQQSVIDELATASEGIADARHLRERALEIRGRIEALHSHLMGARLDVSVIHGDYGLHNMLFRRDGSATVHDFELARRDWRLVDVVETLARLPRAARASLLAGYRAGAGGEPADWRYLGTMWEYHRLGGVIRSWESYVQRGDPHRLAVARARLEEADRMRATEVSEWL